MMGEFVDPVTGDRLSFGEQASRLLQRIIRRWIFLGSISAVTVYVWAVRDPIWHHSPADTWNYFLSWLAVAIESVVGMFWFAQSLRDAVLIRRIFREHGEQLRAQAAEIAVLRAQVAELHAVVVGGASVRRRGPDGRFVAVKRDSEAEAAA